MIHDGIDDLTAGLAIESYACASRASPSENQILHLLDIPPSLSNFIEHGSEHPDLVEVPNRQKMACR